MRSDQSWTTFNPSTKYPVDSPAGPGAGDKARRGHRSGATGRSRNAAPAGRDKREPLKFCAPITILSVLAAALTVACTHSVEIEPERLPELATYKDGHTVVVDEAADGGSGVALRQEHEPVLVVTRDYHCTVSELLRHRCDAIIEVSLEQMSADQAQLFFRVRTGHFVEEYRTVDVPIDEIEHAELRLRNYVPRDWQPRFGLGLTVAGPAILATMTAQVFPIQSVAVELGVSPITTLFNGYSGIRIRPFEFGRARPFVGSWINLHFAADPASGDSAMWSSTGLRLGVDLQLLASQRWLLTLETNLARPLLQNRELTDGIAGQWLPWGGLSTSILF